MNHHHACLPQLFHLLSLGFGYSSHCVSKSVAVASDRIVSSAWLGLAPLGMLRTNRKPCRGFLHRNAIGFRNVETWLVVAPEMHLRQSSRQVGKTTIHIREG